MQVARQLTFMGPTEREMVDYLVGHLGAYRREVVVNYYVALKTRPFVIIAGPNDVDKMSLAQGFAEALVGRPSLQWCSLQAHPWWATHTGDASYLAVAHARFNALKLLDFVEAATAGEAAELTFFTGIERMSPAEVLCYFGDLPRGQLWRADGSTVRIHLPSNLYVTGTLETEHIGRPILSPEMYHHATLIQMERADCTPRVQRRSTLRWRPDWQQCLVGAAIRRCERARAKLAHILPKGHVPLAPLYELERRLGLSNFDLAPLVCEEAWLYLANSFASDGHGLFVEPVIENLRIAQDYVLVQSVLPRVCSLGAEAQKRWAEVTDYLAPHSPRAHAWAEYLTGHGAAGPS